MASSPAGTVTRSELIRRISFELGDRKDLVATANSAASVITDTNNLTDEANYLEDREVLCVRGNPANVGLSRAVSGSSRETRSLTVASPFPQPIRVGDTFIVVKFRGTGWRIWEYVQAINSSISEAADYHNVQVRDSLEMTDRFSDGTGIVMIPDTWTHLASLSVHHGGVAGPGQTYRGPAVPDNTATRNAWRGIPRAQRRGDAGYWLNGYEAEISGSWRTWGSTTGVIQAIGYTAPQELDGPQDWTTINPEWLVSQCCAKLLRAGLDRDRQREGLASYYQSRADSARGLVRTSLLPNTEWLTA